MAQDTVCPTCGCPLGNAAHSPANAVCQCHAELPVEVGEAVESSQIPSDDSTQRQELDWNAFPPPKYKLSPPWLIGLTSLLGGPAAGALLFALNSRALRNHSQMLLGIGVGLVFTWLWVDRLYDPYELVPYHLEIAVFYFGLSMWAYRSIVRQHVQRGGRVHRVGFAVACALACILLSIAIDHAAYAAFPLRERDMTVVEVGNGHLISYKPPVSGEEARRLGEVLLEVKFLGDNRRSSIYLTKQNDGYHVAIVYNPKALDRSNITAGIPELRTHLSHRVFLDQPLTVDLCDPYLVIFHSVH
jgi:hypothetical protein